MNATLKQLEEWRGGTWRPPVNDWNGTPASTPDLHTVLLQEIRDQLVKLNRLLHCQNAIDIPTILPAIEQNTAPKKRKKAKR